MAKGERIAWVGRPGWDVRPNWMALGFTLPGAVACLGILADSESKYVQAVTGTVGLVPLEDPEMLVWLKIFAGTLLVYLALYLVALCVTSPWWTRYALTDRRALIHYGFPVPKLHAKRLTPGTDIAFNGKERGTIHFDEVERDYGIKPKSKPGTASTIKTERVGFVRIDDATHVHALMQEVAHGTPG